MSDSDLKALRALFEELAERANRLRDWAELEGPLSELKTGLDGFLRQVENAVDPPDFSNFTSAAKQAMRTVLQNLQDTCMIDIDGIYKATAAEVRAGQFDYPAVVAAVREIEKAIMDGDLAKLLSESKTLTKEVTRYLRNKRTKVREELKQLQSLAAELQKQLKP